MRGGEEHKRMVNEGKREKDREREAEEQLPNGPFHISITLARAVHVCTGMPGGSRTGQVSFFALFNSR